MYNIFLIIIISAIIIFLHELGHYCMAKLLGLHIDKVSFSLCPFPRFYVSVLEIGITPFKRILYLLSGNITTLIVFLCLNLLSINELNLALIVVALQIIAETNPFYSDYSSVMFWIANKNALKKIPPYIGNKEQEENIQKYIKNIRDSYFLSPLWLLHFVIWGILLVILLKYILIIK